MVQFTDYQTFVKIPSIIIRNGGQSLTHAKDSKPRAHVQIAQPQPQDSTLEVSELTFDQAVEAVTERNLRREIYGRPNTTISIALGDPQSTHARANRDPNAVIYGDLPNSFWAKLLSFLESASNDASSYTNRRDSVLMCEAIRQKLRERGF